MLDDGNSSAYPWNEDQQLLVVANATWSGDRQPSRDPLYIVVPMTCVYAVILVSGVVGNLSTCVVISRNKHMHTATNYYLFSLAVSDLLLLTMGLPPEMYYIWSRYPYVFGEFFCRLTSFATETSANATVLTVTAFTVERYIAICHPFLSYTVSKLSRAVKFIFAIWVLALCLAFPQAIQFGVVTFRDANGTEVADSAQCSIKWQFLEHAFHISTGVLFVLPMTLITVLYALIGLKLRRSRLLKGPPSCAARNQNHVVRMLVAVVVAFFICWAPFHCQRLLAVYASGREENGPAIVFLYTALTYISGILYFVSTTVNPLLYHTMSNKFRQAFKTTLAQLCSPGRGGGGRRGDSRCYSTLARPSARTLVARTSLTSTAAHPQQRQPSVAAIHDPRQAPARRSRTDTISNSSLKDVVAGEFAGYELVRYMGELNGR